MSSGICKDATLVASVKRTLDWHPAAQARPLVRFMWRVAAYLQDNCTESFKRAQLEIRVYP